MYINRATQADKQSPVVPDLFKQSKRFFESILINDNIMTHHIESSIVIAYCHTIFSDNHIKTATCYYIYDSSYI